ncbi:MAG: DNA polymerase III subunit delta [Lachnospiraceae bacterium]|jgi:DNA polymerase-3 subunit delta|nr:DNA polymerase III subunit delta [Lachnospiraceae bacterium]
MQTLNQDIKNRTFKPVYCLYGEETYLKRHFKFRLRDAILAGDTMNYHYFEGKDADIRSIIDAADTLPFFADYRLILVENSGLFKKDASALVTYLPSMPESTILLFVEEQMDKRSRLYKAIQKNGYAAQLKRQEPAYIEKWILSLLKPEGKQITRSTLKCFLERTGNDMEQIRCELDKLLSYTAGRDVITTSDVEEIGSLQITGHIFDMVGAVSARQRSRAVALYKDLLALKEPPARILFLLARQFNQLMQVRQLSSEGMARTAIASKLGLNPYIAGKIQTQSQAFSFEALKAAVTACIEAETAVKTGNLSDQLAVELLLVQLSGPGLS